MTDIFDFLHNYYYTVSMFDYNIIGLSISFIGGLLITLFGLPSIGLLNEGMYIEIEITRKIRICSWISRAGLFMIMIGFLFQLIPAVKTALD